MAIQLPTKLVVKHFISTDPVNNALDTQFNTWKGSNQTLFIPVMQYGFLIKPDGSAEYSLLVAGYDTTVQATQQSTN